MNRFQCTKCVHVSILKFLDSMMFYMIRGFQRLQIYNFWIHRTKDMNLIVWQKGLIQFEIDFNLNSESMKYYCTTGFYMSQGFQWYIICYFSSYRSKDMNYQRLEWNLIEIPIWIEFKSGADTCHVLIERYRFSQIAIRSRRI
jgi:hypothetical protein